MASLLVFGDINVDILARVQGFGGLGGDHLAPEMQLHCGGVAANTALALARWGASVRLLGCVGRDCFGDFALAPLRASGVDVSPVQRTAAALTGMMFIAISPGGERTIFGSRGANAILEGPIDAAHSLEGVAGLHLFGYSYLSQAGEEFAEALIEQARRRHIWISFDPGVAPCCQLPRRIALAAQAADLLFLAEEEAAMLTRQSGRAATLRELSRWSASEIVVKLGEQGSLLREGADWIAVPPLPVPAVDSTGAGDAFAAAFLWARLQKWPRHEVALLASASGAAAATVMGAGERMPGREATFSALAGACLADCWEPVRRSVLERLREPCKLAEIAGTSGD